MQRRDFLALIAIPTAWAQQAAKPDWRPSVFDDHQNDTVIALTELIIPQTDTPGAKAARVNRYIDLFLRDGSAEQRARFIDGLNALDGRAIRAHGHSFVNCTAEQQTAMLTALDQAKAPFFRQAKSLTSRIYYSTQIGYQELNKGGRVPASFGCKHSGHA
jgi:hypothetical protein